MIRNVLAVLILLLSSLTVSAQVRPVTGEIAALIEAEAIAANIEPYFAKVVAQIESSGNCNARTGSYRGLFQLSYAEFERHGGGNIYDCRDNARAAMSLLNRLMDDFRDVYARDPDATETYLLHQQGFDGLLAHLAQPDRLAWISMVSTREGQDRGENWAKSAIWGNVPGPDRKRLHLVDNVTSRDFVDMWRERVEGPQPKLWAGSCRPLYLAPLR